MMKKTIATHNGGFHTDDLFGVATLLLVEGEENATVIRTRDPEIIKKADYAVDVGEKNDPDQGRHDHHQEGGAGKRENGTPFASAGLLWRIYGEKLAGSLEVAREVDRELFQPIDAFDNGVNVYTETFSDLHPYIIQRMVMAFEPVWGEEKTRTNDEAFFEALPIACRIIEREIARARAKLASRDVFRSVYDAAPDKKILILDGGRRWDRVFLEEFSEDFPEVLYMLRPTESGNWEVVCGKDNFTVFENRKSLPESWAGKRGEELARVSGVPDAVFCHNKLFIAVAKTKEGALKLAERALEA